MTTSKRILSPIRGPRLFFWHLQIRNATICLRTPTAASRLGSTAAWILWLGSLGAIFNSSHKEEWNNATGSNTHGPRDDHVKWSQRKTNIIWCRLCVGSKNMVQMSLFTKQKLSHRCREQTSRNQVGDGGGGGVSEEVGIDRDTAACNVDD